MRIVVPEIKGYNNSRDNRWGYCPRSSFPKKRSSPAVIFLCGSCPGWESRENDPSSER